MAKRKSISNNYNDIRIQVLEEGWMPVSRGCISDRPVNGLHHAVWEIVDNAVDEALSGFGSRIDVTINHVFSYGRRPGTWDTPMGCMLWVNQPLKGDLYGPPAGEVCGQEAIRHLEVFGGSSVVNAFRWLGRNYS